MWNSDALVNRRDFLRIAGGYAAVILAQTAGYAHAADPSFTDWGWPLPYERVSDQSIKWLKEKGWWPLPITKQPVFSGANATWYTMDHLGLLAKRGIEANFVPLLTGPAVNEAFVSGKVVVGHAGNLPFVTMVEKDLPVLAFGVEAPNIKIAVIVPKDSGVQRLSDLKGRGKPAAIALTVGGVSDFYFGMAAKAQGLIQGRDYILQNLSNAEMATLPKGPDALIPMEPHRSLMIKERNLGRQIDINFPYMFFMGYSYFRRELHENAPDVAQAVVDAYVEAQLWIRRYPDQTLALMKSVRELAGFPTELLAQQIAMYNNLYKPTSSFLFDEFWATENARIGAWLYENKVTRRLVTSNDLSKHHAPQYQERTYKKLGWRIPSRPPWIPSNWSGKVGVTPYPEYLQQDNLQQPQPWPEPADLVAPWSFGGRTYNPS